MPKYTEEEKELLAKYVTDTESDVFAVKDLHGIVGAVYARYSRAKGGFRETLLNEFIKKGMVDSKKAEELIERVLVAFGDDSVGELEGAHVSFENMSWLGEKGVVDHRIGGAFITQSTRYVMFDEKDESGRFKYFREEKIMASSLASEYERVMDLCFQTYADLMVPMRAHLEKLKPIDAAEYDIDNDGSKERLADLTEESDIKAFKRTYQADLRSKMCDTLRVLLPTGSLVNTGVFGNGRFFQVLISHLLTSELTELNKMGEKAHQALNKIMPKYVKRAKRLDYVADIERKMQELTDDILGDLKPEPADGVRLMPIPASQEERDLQTTALMLYAYAQHPLPQLMHIVSKLPQDKVDFICSTYLGDREHRRNRPGRALEDGYPYVFDMQIAYQTFKDLQRHRMSSQLWQRFSTRLGFDVPREVKDLGLEDKMLRAESESRELHAKLCAAGLEAEAQYVVLHGHHVRWLFQANDRALMHMLELRSTPQGHPAYRRVAQVMHKLIKERSPWRAEAMKFVDYGDYYWSRADSEARQRAKEKEIDEKYGKSIWDKTSGA